MSRRSGLSSASIRNVMSDLEYLGYIDHPHTSAGRVPTDRGTGFILMRSWSWNGFPRKDQKSIRSNLDPGEDSDHVLKEVFAVAGQDLTAALRHHAAQPEQRGV